MGPPGWDLGGQWGGTCLALFLQALLLSLRLGGYPDLAWVPSANPGRASQQVLGEGYPQPGALGLQHGLRGALDGEALRLSPLVFNRAALHFGFFLFFFSLLGLSSCNALELSCSAAPQLWSGIKPLSPALQGRFLTIQTTVEVPAFPFLIVGFCILFHFQEKSSGPKRHRN